MRHLVTDVALLAYIAKKKLGVVSYTEATKACRSSSSASRALHQLINEGILDPQPKLIGLRYVTQYVVTDKGRKASDLALQLTQLREVAKAAREKSEELDAVDFADENTSQTPLLKEATKKQEQPEREQPTMSSLVKKKKIPTQRKPQPSNKKST